MSHARTITIVLCAAAALMYSSMSCATVVVWRLQDVAFSNGVTFGGYIAFDASLLSDAHLHGLVDWNITSSPVRGAPHYTAWVQLQFSPSYDLYHDSSAVIADGGTVAITFWGGTTGGGGAFLQISIPPIFLADRGAIVTVLGGDYGYEGYLSYMEPDPPTLSGVLVRTASVSEPSLAVFLAFGSGLFAVVQLVRLAARPERIVTLCTPSAVVTQYRLWRLSPSEQKTPLRCFGIHMRYTLTSCLRMGIKAILSHVPMLSNLLFA